MAPYKVICFIWLVDKNAILTWDKLIRRGMIGPSVCCLYSREAESVNHIFLSCQFESSIWLFSTLTGSVTGLDSISDLWSVNHIGDEVSCRSFLILSAVIVEYLERTK